MNVEKVAQKLDEISALMADIRETPISKKVVPLEEQREMWERVENVFDRYEAAIENDEKYIPLIRKELNHIIYMLKRWIEYDAKYFEECIGNIAEISGIKKYLDDYA